MDIDKLIEEKTECFTGNGDYYFTYVTPEDCKKIVEEALKQGQSLPIDSVVGQSEQFTPKQLYILAQKHSIQDFQKILKEAPTWKG